MNFYLLFHYKGQGATVKRFFDIFLDGYSVLATSYVAYVAHLGFLRDVWIRTQIAAVASGRATNCETVGDCETWYRYSFNSWCVYNNYRTGSVTGTGIPSEARGIQSNRLQ